ncbi:hypothetical protein [Arthrobacter nitrophenolicus]|uniref:Uncharacterized protein n=2 Tax=Arthrobacter nitrophenolicus TaxID=683150 RepID=A0ACC6TK29_9MICC|nr:hypothetical protein [Arthrobacter nitrophenolicus]ELT42977.1 hypothetical protein G205_21169 [Arthrobacter nitrophenolicus]
MSIDINDVIRTLTAHRIPDEHHTDPELMAIGFNLTRLGAPASDPEERIYNASTIMPSDSPDEDGYEIPTRDLLHELYTDQLTNRLEDLLDADDAQAVAHLN